MRVLQLSLRSVLTAAAVSLALTGCGDSSPDVPFNPAGTSADLAAVNETFASPTFASFSSFGLLFDAALGGAPLVSGSAAALDIRATTAAGGLRASAVRSARRLAGIFPGAKNGNFSASSSAIPPGVAGKTFVYDPGSNSYVASDLTGAPSTGVRFLLYAVNPVTLAPVQPLSEVGHVDLVDLSSGSTTAARVTVVSGDITYINYTVTATTTASSGRVTVAGLITDGNTEANFNLRSTLTSSAGLSLTYSLTVPQRDVAIDLTLNATGIDQTSGTLDISLDMHGPNGTVSMAGRFTETGGTLTVRTGGNLFATITRNGIADPVITGANGQPLTDDDVRALTDVFNVTGDAFGSFDQLVAPVGSFMGT